MKLLTYGGVVLRCSLRAECPGLGVVRDSSGAVVPGASMTVLHKDTASKRTSQADAAGFDAIPGPNAGHYQVHALPAGLRLRLATT